jgi:hypothetical protein
MIDGEFTGNGHAGHAAEASYSDDEIAALAGVACDLLPSVQWVGGELKFIYGTGNFLTKLNKEEEKVGAAETFKADPRSYTEAWKRWGKLEGQLKRSVVDVIGGRRVDGWINPPRDQLPENDASKWPLDDYGEPKDPWQEYSTLVFCRVSDGQLFTMSLQYGNRRGMAELLDTVVREAKDHPGCAPVVVPEAIAVGKNFTPLLKVVGWEPFGEGASPPGNPLRLARLQGELRALKVKYAPENAAAVAAKAKGKRGDLDDEIPF